MVERASGSSLGAVSGRLIPDSRYAGDAGDPDPAVAAALAAHVAGRANGAEVLVALAASRLLVPVVAVAAAGSARDGGASPSGGARSGAIGIEKRTEMALVTITGRNGRRALPVFTSTAALAAWRADARPVPVPARLAAQAALTEGADALLVDPAGPVRHVVEGARIRELAAGALGVPAHRESDG